MIATGKKDHRLTVGVILAIFILIIIFSIYWDHVVDAYYFVRRTVSDISDNITENWAIYLGVYAFISVFSRLKNIDKNLAELVNRIPEKTIKGYYQHLYDDDEI